MKQRGFTLLEVLVATLVMAIAVVGLMSALSTSMRNAARLTDYDRAAQMARQKMDELIIATTIPRLVPFQGMWDASITGGLPMGWQARVAPFEKPEGAVPGTPILERIELQVWWTTGEKRRTFNLEGFRRAVMMPEEAGQ